MEFIRAYQLNIMLFMSGMCGILAILSCISKVLSPKRRRILTFIEIFAMLLLAADWLAYRFRGNPGGLGFAMVRISNFLTFLMPLLIVHEITIYLDDLLNSDIVPKTRLRRILACEALFTVGVILLLISQFTGLYYYFDETNTYFRGPGNIFSFVIPGLIALIQLSVAIQYNRRFSRLMAVTLVIYTVLPLIAAVIQIFAYGLSLVNISIVGVAILLYIFVVVDMNRTVERSRQKEQEFYIKEKEQRQTLFEQTAEALASAIDAKDKYTHGHSSRVASYSRQIARECGKSEEECEQILFAALLHDVGKIGIADSIINKEGKLTSEEYDAIKLHPVYGYQILSKIGASPYLSIGARYHHERYDGRGYPDGLAGEEIPEIARIIAVADAYDAMSSKRSYRDPLPQQKVREELVKGLGTQFDPVFAKAMIHLIDLDTEYQMQELENGTHPSFSTGLVCENFRRPCSASILLNDRISRIHFNCSPVNRNGEKESIPAILLFDSLDATVPETEAKKKDLLYYEYAFLRLDGEMTAEGVRKAETRILPGQDGDGGKTGTPADGGKEYDIEAVRIRDHVLIRTADKEHIRETIFALPDNTRFAYIAFTGQNCMISDIRISEDETAAGEDTIPRIAEEVSFIRDCPEGDLPNIQIEGWRQDSTAGVPVDGSMKITFHTKSLPSARLVWHCPFICLFTSGDRKVEGKNYREFALVRLDGENWHTDDQVTNETAVRMTDGFPGWDEWKNRLKAGTDCTILLRREGDAVHIDTENIGIHIHSVITIRGFGGEICAALTGDQCTITDIHIS